MSKPTKIIGPSGWNWMELLLCSALGVLLVVIIYKFSHVMAFLGVKLTKPGID